MALLNTLGAATYHQGEYPGYASCIAVELWANAYNSYYVKVSEDSEASLHLLYVSQRTL